MASSPEAKADDSPSFASDSQKCFLSPEGLWHLLIPASWGGDKGTPGCFKESALKRLCMACGLVASSSFERFCWKIISRRYCHLNGTIFIWTAQMVNFQFHIYHLYSIAYFIYATKTHSQHHPLKSILSILILGSHTEHFNTKLPMCIKINNYLKFLQMAGNIL